MKKKICQSCGMPITSNEQLGTNKDGSINMDYCKYCYKNGEFIDKVTVPFTFWLVISFKLFKVRLSLFL